MQYLLLVTSSNLAQYATCMQDMLGSDLGQDIYPHRFFKIPSVILDQCQESTLNCHDHIPPNYSMTLPINIIQSELLILLLNKPQVFLLLHTTSTLNLLDITSQVCTTTVLVIINIKKNVSSKLCWCVYDCFVCLAMVCHDHMYCLQNKSSIQFCVLAMSCYMLLPIIKVHFIKWRWCRSSDVRMLRVARWMASKDMMLMKMYQFPKKHYQKQI